MASFYQTLLYSFVLFLTLFCRLTYSQGITALLSTTITPNSSATTSTINSTTISNDANSSVTSNTSLILNNSTYLPTTPITITISTTIINSPTNADTSTYQSRPSGVDTTDPSKTSSRRNWWLLVVLLITIVIIIIAGIIFYHRQHSPYRRFLQNWRSRDDDTDNIILQLEQPEITNGQWPPRISFT